jgi:hypothetical protein
MRSVSFRAVCRIPGLLLVALCLAPSGGLLSMGEKGRPGPLVQKKAEPRRVFYSNPGPWGELEYSWMYLEAPEELLENFPMPSTVTRWVFEGMTPAGVSALFVQAGLGTEQVQKLMSADTVATAPEGVVLEPRPGDLEGLTPEQRGVVYARLGNSDLNPFHKDPVFIPGNDLAGWLRNTGVNEAQADRIRRFLYLRNGALVFSDVSALLHAARSDREARALFKLCTRTRTLVAKLHVGNRANLEELVGFWGGGNRSRVLPILQSVQETDGLDEIDITHLLPPMPRKLLYSFPVVGMGSQGHAPDCHWTTLNFFNYNARDVYLDTRLATANVLENYSPVQGDWKFGDALLFLDQKTGSAVHSCVFIADQIVFTKNGSNLVTPWILMTLDEVRKFYDGPNPVQLVAYRKKTPGERSAGPQ